MGGDGGAWETGSRFLIVIAALEKGTSVSNFFVSGGRGLEISTTSMKLDALSFTISVLGT